MRLKASSIIEIDSLENRYNKEKKPLNSENIEYWAFSMGEKNAINTPPSKVDQVSYYKNTTGFQPQGNKISLNS